MHTIGRHSYGKPNIVGAESKLSIGSFCSISSDVIILLGREHRIDWVTTFPFNVKWPIAKEIVGHPTSKGDIVIGNDVWIGMGVLILSGVTIGDGAVIGARSVVTSDVKPYSVYAGNPAKFIKFRFKKQQIDELLKIKWWEWSDNKIEKVVRLMLTDDIDKFIEYCKSNENNNDIVFDS